MVILPKKIQFVAELATQKIRNNARRRVGKRHIENLRRTRRRSPSPVLLILHISNWFGIQDCCQVFPTGQLLCPLEQPYGLHILRSLLCRRTRKSVFDAALTHPSPVLFRLVYVSKHRRIGILIRGKRHFHFTCGQATLYKNRNVKNGVRHQNWTFWRFPAI